MESRAADAKYKYVLASLGVRTEGNKVRVQARLTGDFPSSAVELEHIFTLSGNKIVSLEIR